MSENHIATSDKPELHSFVKLAIAYLGIMAGFALLGLTFYVVAARGEATGGALEPVSVYYANVGNYLILLVLSILALGLLVKRMRAGAYVAFAALVLSIFAPKPVRHCSISIRCNMVVCDTQYSSWHSIAKVNEDLRLILLT